MKTLATLLKRGSFLTLAAVFGGLLAAQALVFPGTAEAATISSRSLTISSSANGTLNVGNPGSGTNGQRAEYTFQFTVPTTGNVGSVLFQVCTSPLPGTTCTLPTGFTAVNASSVATTGTGFGSFSVDTTTDLTGSPYNCDASSGPAVGRVNCIAISRTAASVNSSTVVTAQFGGGAADYITNPTGDNEDFFVRITTYSDNGFATSVDQGTVASSTAQQVDITARVQEVLNFSVGTTVTAPGTACDPFSDTGALNLGDSEGVLSFAQAFAANSYFRLSTNAINGTAVYYSGDTLTNTSNPTETITPVDAITAEASAVGTEQFGLGVDSSDTQTGSGHSFTDLSSTSPYNSANGTITNGGSALFAFDPNSLTSPVQIASAASVVTCDTGSVRYLGNIATTTAPGVYATTITYLAVPTY